MSAGTGGRPLNTKAGGALKAAALRLIRDAGYDKVSIAAIAQEAGVARQTLYNRWNTKADLVLEAVFDETHSYAAQPDLQAGEDCRQLLEDYLVKIFEHLNIDGDTLRALIAAAQQDAAFHASLFANFVLPREKIMTNLLYQAQDRAELSAHRNPELISTMIHGAFWYRLLNNVPLTAEFAKELVSEVYD